MAATRREKQWAELAMAGEGTASKPKHKNSIPGTHTVGGKLTPQSCLLTSTRTKVPLINDTHK